MTKSLIDRINYVERKRTQGYTKKLRAERLDSYVAALINRVSAVRRA